MFCFVTIHTILSLTDRLRSVRHVFVLNKKTRLNLFISMFCYLSRRVFSSGTNLMVFHCLKRVVCVHLDFYLSCLPLNIISVFAKLCRTSVVLFTKCLLNAYFKFHPHPWDFFTCVILAHGLRFTIQRIIRANRMPAHGSLFEASTRFFALSTLFKTFSCCGKAKYF